MIKFMHIENFKTFLSSDFPLAGLNLFTGMNGMGKSSVMQSLLLLRQSFEPSGVIGGLALNGNYVSLGMGRDILSEDSDRGQILFRLKWQNEKARDFLFDVEADSDNLNFCGSCDFTDLPKKNLFNKNFQYLAADRLIPKINYEMSDFHIRELNSLGVHGEYTVHFIAENASKSLSIKTLMHQNAEKDNFLLNLDLWMGEMAPGLRVQAVLQKQQNTATLSYSFVQGKGTTAQFKPQNVGFGLTYVLPVVTAILKSKPGDLLLIENPESHLHPAAQSVLGRLCCLAATAGVQIFIESHSDHFLNGVRVAVKKGIIEPDNVALFFLERNLKSKRHDSIICNPAIDNNGRLDEWPQGFFDEWEIQLKELL